MLSTCPICGYEDENPNEAVSHCKRCGTDLAASTLEKKVKEAHCYYTFEKKSTNAIIFLTDQRFLAIPEKLEGRGLSMVLTATIVNKMRKKCGVISFPLEEIKAVKSCKVGLLGKEIVIESVNGEVLKISGCKQKDWIEAIKNAAHL